MPGWHTRSDTLPVSLPGSYCSMPGSSIRCIPGFPDSSAGNSPCSYTGSDPGRQYQMPFPQAGTPANVYMLRQKKAGLSLHLFSIAFASIIAIQTPKIPKTVLGRNRGLTLPAVIANESDACAGAVIHTKGTANTFFFVYLDNTHSTFSSSIFADPVINVFQPVSYLAYFS